MHAAHMSPLERYLLCGFELHVAGTMQNTAFALFTLHVVHNLRGFLYTIFTLYAVSTLLSVNCMWLTPYRILFLLFCLLHVACIWQNLVFADFLLHLARIRIGLLSFFTLYMVLFWKYIMYKMLFCDELKSLYDPLTPFVNYHF